MLISSKQCALVESHCLDLLGTPASGLGLAHVGRGLDRGNELEGDVGDTDDADNATGNLAEDLVAEDEAADEDVDCASQLGRLNEEGAI